MKNKGLTLLEMLFALGVTTVILVAMVAVMTRSLAASQYARNKAVADSLVQQGLEKAREVRDQAPDWGSFNQASVEAAIATLPLPSPMASPIGVSWGTVDTGINQKKMVRITVSWTDSKGTHSSEGTTYFAQW